MNHLHTIASDHDLSVEELTKEELEMGLACSIRVRKHLAQQVIKTNGAKYFHNLQVVERVIQNYQKALDFRRLPLRNQCLERIHLSA